MRASKGWEEERSAMNAEAWPAGLAHSTDDHDASDHQQDRSGAS
jgi:hypothetical protein